MMDIHFHLVRSIALHQTNSFFFLILFHISMVVASRHGGIRKEIVFDHISKMNVVI